LVLNIQLLSVDGEVILIEERDEFLNVVVAELIYG
jgi:hypothetical protein